MPKQLLTLETPVYHTTWGRFLWSLHCAFLQSVTGAVALVITWGVLLAIVTGLSRHHVWDDPAETAFLYTTVGSGMIGVSLLGLLFWQLPRMRVVAFGVFVELTWPGRLRAVYEAHRVAYEQYQTEGAPPPDETAEVDEASSDGMTADDGEHWDEAAKAD